MIEQELAAEIQLCAETVQNIAVKEQAQAPGAGGSAECQDHAVDRQLLMRKVQGRKPGTCFLGQVHEQGVSLQPEPQQIVCAQIEGQGRPVLRSVRAQKLKKAVRASGTACGHEPVFRMQKRTVGGIDEGFIPKEGLERAAPHDAVLKGHGTGFSTVQGGEHGRAGKDAYAAHARKEGGQCVDRGGKHTGGRKTKELKPVEKFGFKVEIQKPAAAGQFCH